MMFGPFPNPYRLPFPRKANLDVKKAATLAVDLDTDDFSAVRRAVSILLDVIPENFHHLVDVTVERSAHGYHVYVVLPFLITARELLAYRLLLGDDPVHVAYDLFALLYTPRFPINVLFTSKRGHPVKVIVEGSLSDVAERLGVKR